MLSKTTISHRVLQIIPTLILTWLLQDDGAWAAVAFQVQLDASLLTLGIHEDPITTTLPLLILTTGTYF